MQRVQPKMHKIVYRPKFCSFETKIGQLESIMKKKDSFGKLALFLKSRKVSVDNRKHVKLVQFCKTLLEKQEKHIKDHKSLKKLDALLDNCLYWKGMERFKSGL